MSSAREMVRARLLTDGIGIIETLTRDRNRKTCESAIAREVRDGMAYAYPLSANKKYYVPSPKAARLYGYDPKRYMHQPSESAIAERLTIAIFCWKHGVELLTRRVLARKFPAQAKCVGPCATRYYIDKTKPQPLLTVICPDFGSSVYRTARKARKTVNQRKEHQAFRDMIYFNLFQVALVTLNQSKADDLRHVLRFDTFPLTIVVIPELSDLLSLGAKS